MPLIRDATAADFDAIVRLNLDSEHFMSPMDRARLDVLASQPRREIPSAYRG